MIKFKTINCEGKQITKIYENVMELQQEYNSENCGLPMLDDRLLYANIDGYEISGNLFIDIIQYLVTNYGFID